MSIGVLTAPEAGWYPDPLREAAYRWWDGSTWTMQTHAEVTRTPVLMPVDLFAPAPVLDITPPAARPDGRRAKTRWIPLLRAYPVVYPIAVAMIAGLAYAGGAASSIPTLIVVAAVVAVLALIPAFVFAANDRRDLIERGFAAPSPGWAALFPPIGYLLARRRILAN